MSPLPKAEQLLQLLAEDPFRQPPPNKALVGDLRGSFSRRLNIQHRLVYQVLREETIVKVLRLWTHYEWDLRREAAPEAPHTGDLLATAAITGGSEDQTQFS